MSTGNHERAATALLLLGTGGIVVGAFLPWELASRPLQAGAAPPHRSGIDLGWGVLTTGAATGLAVVSVRRGWTRRSALGVLGFGLVVAGALLAARVAADWLGAGVSLTVLGGLTLAVAGSLAFPSSLDRALPRPFAGVGSTANVRRGVAAVGVSLLVVQVASTYLVGAGHAPLGSGVWVALAFVAVVGVGSVGWAWSQVLGGFTALIGALLLLSVSPVYLGVDALLWARGTSAFGSDPVVVLPALVGGSALLLAGLLELGGAADRHPSA